jgi:hypothetical protein
MWHRLVGQKHPRRMAFSERARDDARPAVGTVLPLGQARAAHREPIGKNAVFLDE